MKKIYTIFLFFVVLGIQAQSEKSFVKSISAESNQVVLQFAGSTEVNEWNEDFIRITTTVHLTNFNEDILKRLFSVGRYSLEKETNEGKMQLSMPKLLRPVSIKGVQLNERLIYQIFVPKGTNVDIEKPVANTSDVN